MVRVRPGVEADADRVWQLLQQLGRSHRPDPAAFERAFARVLGDESSALLVAERDSTKGAGYIHAVRRESLYASGPVCWISEMVVDERSRRFGVGSALVEAAERCAAQSRCVEMTLATARAGEFYEALGYRQTAGYYKKSLDAGEGT